MSSKDLKPGDRVVLEDGYTATIDIVSREMVFANDGGVEWQRGWLDGELASAKVFSSTGAQKWPLHLA